MSGDDEIRGALRGLPVEAEPLDPQRVIAGAKRRRTRAVAAASIASAAMVGAVVATIAMAGGVNGSAGPEPADDGSSTAATPSGKTPSRTPAKATPSGQDAARVCRAAVLEHAAGAAPDAALASSAVVTGLIGGPVGTVVILADGKNWVACDDTRVQDGSGTPTLLEPRRIAPPAVSDTGAFEVSSLVLTVNGKMHDYYWAAGMLPPGVATVRYTFPDGGTKDSVSTGRGFWAMQYRESKPATPGQSQLDRDKIQVKLLRADGSAVRTFRLTWGEQTCAQVNHGC